MTWIETWWREWSGWWFSFLAGMLVLFGVSGCDLFNAHIKQMDTLRAMSVDVSSRLTEGGYGQVTASGQGLNPGVEVEAAIKYTATARYVGMAGQFAVGAQGQLGERPGRWEDILAIVNDTSTSDAECRAALRKTIETMLHPAEVTREKVVVQPE